MGFLQEFSKKKSEISWDFTDFTNKIHGAMDICRDPMG